MKFFEKQTIKTDTAIGVFDWEYHEIQLEDK